MYYLAIIFFYVILSGCERNILRMDPHKAVTTSHTMVASTETMSATFRDLNKLLEGNKDFTDKDRSDLSILLETWFDDVLQTLLERLNDKSLLTPENFRKIVAFTGNHHSINCGILNEILKKMDHKGLLTQEHFATLMDSLTSIPESHLGGIGSITLNLLLEKNLLHQSNFHRFIQHKDILIEFCEILGILDRYAYLDQTVFDSLLQFPPIGKNFFVELNYTISHLLQHYKSLFTKENFDELIKLMQAEIASIKQIKRPSVKEGDVWSYFSVEMTYFILSLHLMPEILLAWNLFSQDMFREAMKGYISEASELVRRRAFGRRGLFPMEDASLTQLLGFNIVRDAIVSLRNAGTSITPNILGKLITSGNLRYIIRQLHNRGTQDVIEQLVTCKEHELASLVAIMTIRILEPPSDESAQTYLKLIRDCHPFSDITYIKNIIEAFPTTTLKDMELLLELDRPQRVNLSCILGALSRAKVPCEQDIVKQFCFHKDKLDKLMGYSRERLKSFAYRCAQEGLSLNVGQVMLL